MTGALGKEQQYADVAQAIVLYRAFADVQVGQRPVVLDRLADHPRADLVVVDVQRRNVTKLGTERVNE